MTRGLFIIGMERAGTTTVYNCLEAHPDIDTMGDKEPECFNILKANLDINSKIGVHLKTFLNRIQMSEKKRKHYKYLLDATPLYLTDPIALPLIKRFIQEPKFIVLIRDPLERTISGMRWDLAKGRTDYSSVKAENIEKSMIASGLKYLNSNFYRGDILILNSNDLGDKAKILSKLGVFLGLNACNLSLTRSNRSGGTRKYLWLYRLNVFVAEHFYKYKFVEVIVKLVKSTPVRGIYIKLRDEVLQSDVCKVKLEDADYIKLALELDKIREIQAIPAEILKSWEVNNMEAKRNASTSCDK